MVTWTDVVNWLLEHGIIILIILVLAIAAWFLIKKMLPPVVSRIVTRARGESKSGLKKRTDTLVSVFTGVGRVLIVIVALLMLLTEVGVPVGPMLAGFGVAGVAVGFGAQYLIRDLIAGIFILSENQYRIGDVAKVADIFGTVEDITLRKTVLRDLDGGVHHVPNGEIRVASNYSRHFSRVNLDVPVAYGTDLERAFDVINRVGQELAEDQEWKAKLVTPPRALRVNKFGDSGIDIKILCDVKPAEQWAVSGELRLRLKKAFDAEAIEIPWPHMKVYFGNEPPDNGKDR